jgi:aryl-alcohol dehydrogenase-like predicted oxidoreductase
VIFDEFYRYGGRTFDTSWQYGRGIPEKILGEWIRQRGVRKEVSTIVKGAHTPFCDPANLRAQLHESLDRLQTDRTEIYLMHRDNLEIPVGEFVDVMHEEAEAGRIGIFGGSNWSIDRLREARAYAEKNGKRRMQVVSNNLSLAEMVDPVWKGCISSKAKEFRSFLAETGMLHCAWSSQARGFFTDRAGRDNRSDAGLVRCWYSEENFQRRDRALTLAQEKNVLPINIAAAWVLQQPFPSCALIGPRSLAELRTSLPALALELTPQELDWLDLRADQPG